MPEELGIAWTAADNKLFESALGESAHRLGPVEPNWESFQRMHLAGKNSRELKRRYDLLVRDVEEIEAGRVQLPDYPDANEDRDLPSGSGGGGNGGGGGGGAGSLVTPVRSVRRIPASTTGSHQRSDHPPQERRKGVPWSEDEHKLFLRGLEVYGKGDWRSISRHFVVTRTPTQVASHAQKYFLRLASNHKDKRRNSIHDITSAVPVSTRPAMQQSH